MKYLDHLYTLASILSSTHFRPTASMNTVLKKISTEKSPPDLVSITDMRKPSFSEVVGMGRSLILPERH
jgi:hypothetical protein